MVVESSRAGGRREFESLQKMSAVVSPGTKGSQKRKARAMAPKDSKTGKLGPLLTFF